MICTDFETVQECGDGEKVLVAYYYSESRMVEAGYRTTRKGAPEHFNKVALGGQEQIGWNRGKTVPMSCLDIGTVFCVSIRR